MKFPTFSAELAFRIISLGAVGDYWLGLRDKGTMPVLIFTIFRRDGMRCADWIGLN